MSKSARKSRSTRSKAHRTVRSEPAEPKTICPHCGKLVTARTVRSHLLKQRSDPELGEEPIDVFEDEPGLNQLSETHLEPSSRSTSVAPFIQDTPEAAQPATSLNPPSPLATSTTSIRRNPPVTIEDWPDPEDNPSDIDDEDSLSNGLTDEDNYACVDDPQDDSEAALQFAQLSDEQFLALLKRELGDAFNSEIQSIYDQAISTDDIRIIKMLSAKLRAHFSNQTYEEFRCGFAEEIGLPTEYIAWRRIHLLSGVESIAFDCCVNSCCAFLGKHKDRVTCSFCSATRFNAKGLPRKVYHYTPIIPQLQALFQNPELVEKLGYRSRMDADHSPELVRDVFDGAHYRSLLGQRVHPDRPYCFFDDHRDLALGLSLDGFNLFKRRRKGTSTAWPLILVNYNLTPEVRTHLEHTICVGVIPGPRQFKDLNSFLIPLLDELEKLESGVETLDKSAPRSEQSFCLRAFLILAFGDIPAISKLLAIKGHGGICPCRTCCIHGVTDGKEGSHSYYVPMTLPGEKEYNDPWDLPMRSPELFSDQLAEMEAAHTKAAREELARTYGINSRCILSRLRSINLPASFPYDFMHLIYENLVPNLILHWTGNFKKLDEGSGNYQLTPDQWDAIGRETAAATSTLPASFVGTLPDIARDQSLFKAEAYGFWIQYVAPIVLKRRLAERYYNHVLELRDILDLCLQYEITKPQIDSLETMVIRWVADYECYYYQYSAARVSACPLTIHALLHIPFYIRQSGPVWASWAYVMERFCGSLLPAIKNRVKPYPCIDNYVLRRAQMQAISAIYQIQTLRAPPPPRTTTHLGVEFSSWETIYADYPATVLGRPVIKPFPINTQLLNQLVRYFGLVLVSSNPTPSQVKALIKLDSVVRYGRVRIANGGDAIRTAEEDNMARDNSYVRYTMWPDANAHSRRLPDHPICEVNYGQLLDVFYVELNEHNNPSADQRYLLARVLPCSILSNRDATEDVVEYEQMARTSIVINLMSIEAAVGRVKRYNTWA